MLRWAIVCAIASGACVHDDLVTCGDQVCPAGSLCDTVSGMCADPSGLSVPPDLIDLHVACGGTSMTTFPLRNVSSKTISFSIVSTITGVMALPPSATLAPGDELDIQLMTTAPSESIPGIPVSGNLLVAIDGNQLLGRQLQLTTSGAVMTTPQQTLDFGESSVPSPPIVRTFPVANSGDQDATLVPGSVASPYSLTSSAPIQIPAQTTQEVGIIFQPLAGSFDSTLALSFTNNTCQPPPASIALSGVGTGDTILVDHLVLDFGTAICSAGATTLPLTFTNNDAMSQPLAFTISGPQAALYSATTAPILDAGPSMATVLVTRSALPPGIAGMANATLSVSAPALSSPATIALDQLVQAPVLTLVGGSINFGMLPQQINTQQSFELDNSGNVVANVTITPSFDIYTGGTTISISPSTFQIPPNGKQTVTVAFSTGTAMLNTTVVEYVITATGTCTGPLFATATFGVQ